MIKSLCSIRNRVGKLQPFEYDPGTVGCSRCLKLPLSIAEFCHSDLRHAAQTIGESLSTPLCRGHEIIGTVAAKGRGMSNNLALGAARLGPWVGMRGYCMDMS
jgi:D-arabinose 1-dehydrogenase-like Zn-dependent alcohol dehydrogenase